MRISDWSSDVCSSDLLDQFDLNIAHARQRDPQLRITRLMRPGIDIGKRKETGCLIFAFEQFHGRIQIVGDIGDLMVPSIGPCEHYSILRSEEHTSELQSLMRISYAVFCLKKKKTPKSKP